MYSVVYFTKKLYGLSWFVCVHTCVYLTSIWTYVVMSVIIVACMLCVLLSMCIFVLCVGEIFVECVCYMCG